MDHSNWLSAFVLNRRSYRETSLMVDCFSRETGKIRFIAKGVRNSKNDKKSLLQSFQPLSLQLRGRSELKNLTAVEAKGPSFTLIGNALFCGMYVNELLNRIMPSELASESVFDEYFACMQRLAKGTEIELSLRRFEFALLDEMGSLPDFTQDSRTGEAIVEQAFYHYVEGEGLIRASDTKRGYPIMGEALIKLSSEVWDRSALHGAKLLNRQLLAPLLGDKPLASRALFAARKPSS